MLRPLLSCLCIGAALCCIISSSANAQEYSHSEWVPQLVQIRSSGTNVYAICGLPSDDIGDLAVGNFSSTPPSGMWLEMTINCYDNPIQAWNAANSYTGIYTLPLAGETPVSNVVCFNSLDTS